MLAEIVFFQVVFDAFIRLGKGSPIQKKFADSGTSNSPRQPSLVGEVKYFIIFCFSTRFAIRRRATTNNFILSTSASRGLRLSVLQFFSFETKKNFVFLKLIFKCLYRQSGTIKNSQWRRFSSSGGGNLSFVWSLSRWYVFD